MLGLASLGFVVAFGLTFQGLSRIDLGYVYMVFGPKKP